MVGPNDFRTFLVLPAAQLLFLSLRSVVWTALLVPSIPPHPRVRHVAPPFIPLLLLSLPFSCFLAAFFSSSRLTPFSASFFPCPPCLPRLRSRVLSIPLPSAPHRFFLFLPPLASRSLPSASPSPRRPLRSSFLDSPLPVVPPLPPPLARSFLILAPWRASPSCPPHVPDPSHRSGLSPRSLSPSPSLARRLSARSLPPSPSPPDSSLQRIPALISVLRPARISHRSFPTCLPRPISPFPARSASPTMVPIAPSPLLTSRSVLALSSSHARARRRFPSPGPPPSSPSRFVRASHYRFRPASISHRFLSIALHRSSIPLDPFSSIRAFRPTTFILLNPSFLVVTSRFATTSQLRPSHYPALPPAHLRDLTPIQELLDLLRPRTYYPLVRKELPIQNQPSKPYPHNSVYDNFILAIQLKILVHSPHQPTLFSQDLRAPAAPIIATSQRAPQAT